MSRVKNILTVKKVESIKKVGLHKDGGNLYLKVTATGSRSWVFRYTINAQRHYLGLGSFEDVGLQEARESADKLRGLLRQNIDPLKERERVAVEKLLEVAKLMTFSECADAFVGKHIHELKNKKHIQQWRNTLNDYAYPHIGQLPITSIDTALVIKCLEPIWLTKNETASRVRGRIEQVLAWATVSGYRVGDNPARWRGHLDKLLPKPSKVQNVKHHAALDYKLIPEFMRQLRQQVGIAARCLEFTIMTATRTNEAIGAIWSEIDLESKLWIIPADRMKAEREHIIPLSNACITILIDMQSQQLNNFVFSGQSRNGGLSNMAMLKVLERMGRKDLTVHGFRSTFSDWVSEQTNHSSDTREMCLAHTIANKAEAAYRRGDMIDKRFKVMTDWADYLDSLKAGANVIPFKKAATM